MPADESALPLPVHATNTHMHSSGSSLQHAATEPLTCRVDEVVGLRLLVQMQNAAQKPQAEDMIAILSFQLLLSYARSSVA